MEINKCLVQSTNHSKSRGWELCCIFLCEGTIFLIWNFWYEDWFSCKKLMISGLLSELIHKMDRAVLWLWCCFRLVPNSEEYLWSIEFHYSSQRYMKINLRFNFLSSIMQYRSLGKGSSSVRTAFLTMFQQGLSNVVLVAERGGGEASVFLSSTQVFMCKISPGHKSVGTIITIPCVCSERGWKAH